MATNGNNKTHEEYAGHFKDAFSDFGQVLNEALSAQLEEVDKDLQFPESPADVLEYLGNIEPLKLSEADRIKVREMVQKEVDEKGANHVWDSKHRLKLEIHYLAQNMWL